MWTLMWVLKSYNCYTFKAANRICVKFGDMGRQTAFVILRQRRLLFLMKFNTAAFTIVLFR